MRKGKAVCTGWTDPSYHVWRRTAAVAWFVCSSCGCSGVCTICYGKLGRTIPQGALPMACPEHGTTWEQSHYETYEREAFGASQEG